MTTAPLPPAIPGTVRPRVVGPELGTASAATAVGGVLLVAVAAVVTGGDGALAAAVGVATVLVFFGFGALVVGAVAGVSPTASLLVALLTYVLQVVAIGLVFVVLSRSGLLGTSVHPGWVAGGVIGSTLVWSVAHIFAATRSRQPVYDLPDSPGDGPGASAS